MAYTRLVISQAKYQHTMFFLTLAQGEADEAVASAVMHGGVLFQRDSDVLCLGSETQHAVFYDNHNSDLEYDISLLMAALGMTKQQVTVRDVHVSTPNNCTTYLQILIFFMCTGGDYLAKRLFCSADGAKKVAIRT